MAIDNTMQVPGLAPPVMTDSSGNVNWGNVIAGGGLAIGDLIRAFGGGSTGDLGRARTAAGMADPFASQRAPYQAQLAKLMSDPGSFQTDPGYQFAKEQGLEAGRRASNSLYGTTRVGGLAPELERYATGFAEQAYDTRVAQLMKLAGVDAGSPGTAGAIYAGGLKAQDQSLAGGITGLSAALGPTLGPLIAKLIGGSGLDFTGYGSGPGVLQTGGPGGDLGGGDFSGSDLGNLDTGGIDLSNIDLSSIDTSLPFDPSVFGDLAFGGL